MQHELFKQISLAQRYQIEVLLQTELTQSEVSRQIAVYRSTISRELNVVFQKEEKVQEHTQLQMHKGKLPFAPMGMQPFGTT